jgi:hypothetical protein
MRLTVRVFVLLAALIFGAGWVSGQSAQQLPASPTVLSGNDIGFRMVGRKGTTPTGRLVVRINGEWVDAELAGGMKLIPTK